MNTKKSLYTVKNRKSYFVWINKIEKLSIIRRKIYSFHHKQAICYRLWSKKLVEVMFEMDKIVELKTDKLDYIDF